MSDKDDDIELDSDDWSMDDDFGDFGGFDEAPKPPPTGREAATAVVSSGVKGAAKVFLSEGRREELILKSLPTEYGAAADSLKEYSSEIRDVGSAARDHLIKTSKEFKRQARQTYPIIAKYLPDGVNKKINSFLKEEDSFGSYNQVDPKEAEMQSAAEGIFGSAASTESPQQQVKDEKESIVTKELKEAAKEVRLGTISRQIQALGDSSARMEGYQNTVTTGYRKKMLEINYKQLFTLHDILDVSKQTMEKVVPNVERIVHNTALPDYAKEQISEVYSAKMKRDVIDAMAPASFTRNFARVLGANAKTALNGFFGSVNDMMSMGGQATQMMMSDDGLGEVKSPYQQKIDAAKSGAAFAGEELAKRYVAPKVDSLLSKVREKAEKNKGVADFGHKLKYYAQNIPNIANSHINSGGMYDGETGGTVNFLLDKLAAIVPSTRGEGIDVSNVSNVLEKPRPWDNKAHHCLTEVIPGLLAKIDQSVRSGFMGSEQPLEQFDYKTDSFVTTAEINNRIVSSVGGEDSKKYLRQEIERIVKDIEDADTTELKDDDRLLLSKLIDKKIRNGNHFNVKDLADGSIDQWENSSPSFELQDKFQSIVSNKDKDKKNATINEKIQKLRNEVGVTNDKMQRAILQYGHGAVVRSEALVKQDDRIIPNAKLLDSYQSLNGNQPLPTYGQWGGRLPPPLPPEAPISPPAGPLPPTPPVGPSSMFTGAGMSFKDSMRQGVVDALFDETAPNSLLKTLNQIKEAPVSNSVKREAIKPLLEEMRDQLKTNNLDDTMKVLLKTLEKIASSRSTSTTSTVNGGTYINVGDTLTKAIELAVKGVKASIGTAAKTAGWGVKKAMGGVSGAGSLTKKGVNWLKESTNYASRSTILHAARDKIRGIRDIYDGDGRLLLSAAKLKAGEYFNANGDPIKYIRDIKGAVYDTLGDVVFSESELADKLATLKYWSNGKWEVASDMFSNAASKLSGGVGSVVSTIKKHTFDNLKKVYERVRVSSDIYVKGENVPRLLRTLMLENRYVSGVSGKPIRDVFDIDGEVKDRDGNVIISETEMRAKGFKLVDKDGQEFKSFETRIKAGIMKRWEANGKLLNKAKAKVKAAGAWAKRKVKAAGKVTADGLRHLNKGVKSNLASYVLGESGTVRSVPSDKVVDRLDTIIDLWVAKFGAPKNIINRLKRARRADKVKPKATPGETPPKPSLTESLTTYKEKLKEKVTRKRDELKGKLTKDTVAKKRDELKARIKEKLKKHKVDEKSTELKEKVKLKLDEKQEALKGHLDEAKNKVSARYAKLKAHLGFTNKAENAPDLSEQVKAKRPTASSTRPEAIAKQQSQGKLRTTRKKKGHRTYKSIRTVSSATPDLSQQIAKGIAAGLKPKNTFGDTDGDGIRDGSSKDTLLKRAKQKAKDLADKARNKLKAKGPDASQKGFIKGLLGAFGPMFGMLLKPLTMIGGILSGGLGGIAKGAMKLAGGLGKAAFNVGKSALGFVGRTVFGAGARAAVGSAASAAFAAIGGVAALPWLVGAAVVGGVGYLAYKKLTAKDTLPVDQLRFAFYGTTNYADGRSDDVAKLLFLEDTLHKYTKYDKQHLASLSGLNEKATGEIYAGMGVKADNPAQVKSFESWLFGRFIPVYMLWCSKIKRHVPGVALKDLNDTKKVTLSQRVELTKQLHLAEDNQIFNVSVGPFSQSVGSKVADTLAFWSDSTVGAPLLSGKEVAEIYKSKLGAWEKEAIAAAKKPKEAPKAKAPIVPKVKLTVVNTKVAIAKKQDGFKQSKTDKNVVVDRPMSLGTAKEIGSGTGNLNTADGKASDARLKQLNLTSEQYESSALIRDASKLNALDAVRIKTYGFGNLDIDHVETAYKMESRMIKDVVFVGKEATYKGNPRDMYNLVKDDFGITNASPLGEKRWYYWFIHRFGPVFLTYIKELKLREPGCNPLNVSVSSSNPHLYEVALATANTKVGVDGKTVSVWDVTLSPFPNGPTFLAGDRTIVNENLEYLKDLKKKVAVIAQKAAPKPALKLVPKLVKKLDGAQNHPTAKPKQVEKLDKKGYATAGRFEGYKFTEEEAEKDPFMAKVFADSSRQLKEKQQNDARPLTANGTYGGIQLASAEVPDVCKMLTEVSKATGVDERLLYTVAFMESAMNPYAAAKGTSAKGLFQFIKGTWNEQIAKFGEKYGIPKGTSPLDPVANALLGAEYLKHGKKTIEVTKENPVNATDIYMSHFLGPTGAKKFLKNMQDSPQDIAALDFNRAALSNQNVFYNKRGGMSYQQVYQKLSQRANQAYRTVAKYGSERGMDVDLTNVRAEYKVPKPIASIVKGDTTAPLAKNNGEHLESLRTKQAVNDAVLAEKETVSAPVTVSDTTSDKHQTSIAKDTAIKSTSDSVTDLRAYRNARVAELKEKRDSRYSQEKAASHQNAQESKTLSKAHGDVAFKQLEVQQKMLGKLDIIATLLDEANKMRPKAVAPSPQQRQAQIPARDLAVSVGRT